MAADSFDHLSQYDPDDQLIQSERSFSIIDSYMSKSNDKKLFGSAKSETSEFSIISSPNDRKSLLSSIASQGGDKSNQLLS